MFIFIFLIIRWYQKYFTKHPKKLHANILLPYRLTLTEHMKKARKISMKFRKSVYKFSMKLACFQKYVT